MRKQWLHAWLVLIGVWLFGQAVAAPAYVTAWPREVPVEKPDPVLGDKPFWEFWVYGEAFARRFKGFPVEKADSGLSKGKLQAMTLRIYKKNFWQEINPDYPEQYACEIDVYLDSTISLPLSESGNPKRVFPAYPRGVMASYHRLAPNVAGDKTAIDTSRPVRVSLKKQPVILAVPLDGRFAQFGVLEYYPSLVPGLSVLTLLSGFECKVAAPLQKGGAHWLSLHGTRPWDMTEGGPPKAMYGQYDHNVELAFDPDPDPESKGYLRIPKAFNEAALQKAALIKVMNWCIHKKHAHANPKGKSMPKENWQPIAYRCEKAEQHGRILPDPQYHSGKDGLQDTGY
ncbi:hypothetical protein [Thiobacillus sp.]